MRFKTRCKSGGYSSLKAEFEAFDTINPRLWGFLVWLDMYTQREFTKEIMITCLTRTVRQQIKYYPEYAFTHNGEPKPSYHLFEPCCAADIRTITTKWFTTEQQRAIKEIFEESHKVLPHDRCLIEKHHIHLQMEMVKVEEPISVGTV